MASPVLPGTGRGAVRSMVEGQVRMIRSPRAHPHPSRVSRRGAEGSEARRGRDLIRRATLKVLAEKIVLNDRSS